MSATQATPSGTRQQAEPDMARLDTLVFQAVTDVGTALNGALVLLGTDLGYVDTDIDQQTGTVMFLLSPEQAMIFSDPDSPAYFAGGYHIVRSVYEDLPRIEQAMREGHGFGWHEHDAELFLGTEQFFRPGYRTHLLEEWLPALDGVHEVLTSGARVADDSPGSDYDLICFFDCLHAIVAGSGRGCGDGRPGG